MIRLKFYYFFNNKLFIQQCIKEHLLLKNLNNTSLGKRREIFVLKKKNQLFYAKLNNKLFTYISEFSCACHRYCHRDEISSFVIK